MRFSLRHFVTSCWMLAGMMAGPAVAADPTPEQLAHFESHIRPLLVKRCVGCHGAEKQQGDLRLDRRVFAIGEGDGPIVPGKVDESRLIDVIQYDELDTQMPPAGKLPDDEIRLLTEWVKAGAPWPDDGGAEEVAHGGLPRTADGKIDFAAAAQQHWAYQPVERPEPPAVQHEDQVRNEIDRFVLRKLEANGLNLSSEADPRTLIRRASVDLIGLSPSYEEVEQFRADESPEAYERVVERLLDSPQYGQRWARHWLDVARYADTKGYVFTENRFYPYSYTYRDYVVEALNSDKPYDRFLIEQIAADQLDLPENDPALAALGFLTVGPRFLNRTPDIIDDRIDVISRGVMGMTVACARCHDHKYDPIPTADYYALYGVFNSCFEPEEGPIVGEIKETPEYLAFKAELDKRQAAVDAYVAKAHGELLADARNRAGDYLLAVLKKTGKLGDAKVEYSGEKEPRDRLTRLWIDFVARRMRENDPVFVPWKLLVESPDEEFADRVARCIDPERSGELGGPANPQILAALAGTPPASKMDVARVYGRVLAEIDQQWQALRKETPDATQLSEPAAEQIRGVLYGSGSVSDVPVGDAERRLFERDHRNQVRNLRKKVADWKVTSPGAPPRAMVLLDKEKPVQPVIFERGNPGRRGDRVPRRFPQILGAVAGEFKEGSGRLELARAVASPENPLTARVIVNRVWMHHFGNPLVATPSDFGTRADPPTHPELLDWLAWTFMHQDNWSLKALHRRIMLSATYRQASGDRPEARTVDPENQLLWRMNRRRLEFEAMRDGLLAAAGRLDPAAGGRPVDLGKKPDFNRRTIYALIDRNNFPGLLRTFDLPSPDSSAPQRPRTTVPQQALFGMNAPFVQEIAGEIAGQVKANAPSPEGQVDAAFRQVLGRDPDGEERALAVAYLQKSPERLTDFVQALLLTNEFMFVD
ncbi:PSD1 and planctomycete cytochrome C domain-containing protein [Maioricimonas sp. JC845]|uniref:PSD1 and planctomycete cytochrome C domain-containing protein n=1 Tax=Maioricimonas sp. JC845 TaxID=3232138 RepID=UPI0034575229